MTPRELFDRLLIADTQAEVLSCLQEAGYWDNEEYWRPVGDNPGNRAIIGNQQEDAVSALAEKITNSVDAILIDRCLLSGIDPRGVDAPSSMRAAIAKFFLNSSDESAGLSRYWGTDRLVSDIEKGAVSNLIWLSVTGSNKQPSITIADRGEGQTPDSFPRTFMALVGFKHADGRVDSQKADIKFVQGQFNMGSTGVYFYGCQPNHFQLLISRRNPAHLSPESNQRDNEWGFTVVRRRKWGVTRGSVFEYLAPVFDKNSTAFGDVMSFAADSLPLLPESPPKSVPNKVYHQQLQYGTLIKLYEYRYPERGISSSHVFRRGGLLTQLDLVLPECGLPVRVVEARDYKGSPGSFQTDLYGILHRVQEMFHRGNQGEKTDLSDEEDLDDEEESPKKNSLGLEGPPVDGDIHVAGVRLPWVAYVFSDKANDQTRSGKYSLIYHLNGQKHAHDSGAFFYDCGYRWLASRRQLLVLLDCTSLDIFQREEVFKPSRDSLRKGELTADIQEVLKDALKNDPKLQKLQATLLARKNSEKLADRAPVRKVLESLLKNTPSLARFFGTGSVVRIPKPMPGTESGTEPGPTLFVGKHHPTYFRFRKGTNELRRLAHLGSRVRLQFEIDAVDEYFSRPRDSGVLELITVSGAEGVSGSRGELESGVFPYNVTLPETARVGDLIELQFKIFDGVIEPLICQATLEVAPEQEKKPGGENTNPVRPSGTANIDDLDIRRCGNPANLREGYDPWPEDEFGQWNDKEAVVIEDTTELENGRLTFYVNCENYFLEVAKNEKANTDHRVVENKFMFSLVLLALSIVQEFKEKNPLVESELGDVDEAIQIDPREMRDNVIRTTSRAMAQLILPMMEAVGAMSPDLLEGEE